MKRVCAKSEYLLAARKLRSSEVTRELIPYEKTPLRKRRETSRTRSTRKRLDAISKVTGMRMKRVCAKSEYLLAARKLRSSEVTRKLIPYENHLFENAERLVAREARVRGSLRFRRQQVTFTVIGAMYHRRDYCIFSSPK